MVIPAFTPLKAWLHLTFGFIVFSMREEEKARCSRRAEPVSQFKGLLQSSVTMLSLLPSPSGGF